MSLDQIFVVVLVGAVLISFFREIYPPEVTALAAAAALLVTGILDTAEFLEVFSSSAPITIAMMFIMSASLERTGVLAFVGELLKSRSRGSYRRALLLMMFGSMGVSAFMNNTPVVILLTPVMMSVAASVGVAPSRLLIPLSFSAILGGTLTLVGTSTNILMSSIARRAGEPPISMFEMTLPGLVFAGTGLCYILLVGRWLLPDRTSLSGLLAVQERRKFVANLLVPMHSRYIGKTLSALPFDTSETQVLDVIRGEKSMKYELSELALAAGDRVVVKTATGEILGLKESGEVNFHELEEQSLEPVSADRLVTMEVSVAPRSAYRGRKLGDLQLRRKYGVYVVALHSDEHELAPAPALARLRFADTLLIEGPPDGIRRMMEDGGFVNLSMPAERAMRRGKAPIAIFTLVAVMGLAAFDVMDIAGLAVIGAVVTMLTGCIDPDEAFESIDWRVLFLIFGMLALSRGVENAGVAQLAIEYVVGHVQDIGPHAILAVVYVLTSTLTELISNNAVVVLIGPIVVSLALELGLDPRPFIFAVMFAASASFATPVGYQTNTFVHNAGGYRFSDFLRIGLPLNVLFAVVAVVILPLFYPF